MINTAGFSRMLVPMYPVPGVPTSQGTVNLVFTTVRTYISHIQESAISNFRLNTDFNVFIVFFIAFILMPA
jgi:hypothetical protein